MKYCPLCGHELRPRMIDGQSRLACGSSGCAFVHWNNPIPVAAGLVQWEGSYVLARNASWPPGLFSLLTGFVEEGELPEAAIVREVHEELGLRVKSPTFLGHFPLPVLNQLIIAYVVEGRGVLRPNREIADVKVVSASELAALDFGPLTLTRAIVTRWLGGAATS